MSRGKGGKSEVVTPEGEGEVDWRVGVDVGGWVGVEEEEKDDVGVFVDDMLINTCDKIAVSLIGYNFWTRRDRGTGVAPEDRIWKADSKNVVKRAKRFK